MGNKKHVNIYITGNQVGLDRDPVNISYKAGEEVVWHCHGGSAVIVFPGDCPFREKSKTYHVPGGGSVSSGLPVSKDKVRQDAYKYAVEVTTEGTATVKSEVFRKDPEVVVDP
jgi:hypothetical protein